MVLKPLLNIRPLCSTNLNIINYSVFWSLLHLLHILLGRYLERIRKTFDNFVIDYKFFYWQRQLFYYLINKVVHLRKTIQNK